MVHFSYAEAYTLTLVFGLFSLLSCHAASVEDCPGYRASNVKNDVGKLTADLHLAGDACNIYGRDISQLRLLVEYQTRQRLHVKIYDAQERVYQIPEDVVPRPSSAFIEHGNDMKFQLNQNPFSFTVSRASTGEILFDTTGQQLVFESQYLRLRTSLPNSPNLYGLGEDADSLRLPTSNYYRTFWNAGEPFLPKNSNIYGSHEVYYDHRGSNGTHAVFLMNSNGVKVNIDVDADGQYLEYNTLGGVLDLYFMSGSDPKDVAMQYGEMIGLPTMMPWWGFGFHQCRYGYQDVYELAGVVANYSTAQIPLETLWTDIDYMDRRRTMSLDPQRFPLDKMRQLISYLHAHDQNYIVMVDPAVARQPYPTYEEGTPDGVFLKEQDGSWYTGVVWAGPSVFPDWFNPNTQDYWNEQFNRFFNKDTGVDIDGLWIDMNEASNFCDYPCNNPGPELFSIRSQDPPRPPPARLHSPYNIPGFPKDFQPKCSAYTTFTVQAHVDATKDVLLVLGNAFALGEGSPDLAPPLYPYDMSPPIWNTTVQLPPHTKIDYEYVLYHYSTDGSYTYERQNRTLHTGACNTLWNPYQVQDTLSSSKRSFNRVRNVNARLTLPQSLVRRQTPPLDKPGSMQGLPGRELLNPPYDIDNYIPWGNLSVQTIPTNIYHSNGLVEFDVHNLYGTMMSTASRNAMESRRPGKRPLIITRSTFAGAGRRVGHWFGDNISTWEDYQISIWQMVQFAALFQMPMVGSDVCGFNDNTTAPLCSRWARLGAFNPFFRNHAEYHTISQEFYRWPVVAESARKAISTRYRLLDYLYTAMYNQNQTGAPTLSPLFFMYPTDENTFGNQEQFFYGDSILVSPILEENSTSVEAYLPNDLFYDFETYKSVRGHGHNVTFSNVSLTDIPVHIRGGSIIPMRVTSAYTTTELRKQNYTIIVAPGLDGTATGSLYIDDGDSIVQKATSMITFHYTKKGFFSMKGTFGYDAGIFIESIVVLGQKKKPNSAVVGGKVLFDADNESVTQMVDLHLRGPVELDLS